MNRRAFNLSHRPFLEKKLDQKKASNFVRRKSMLNERAFNLFTALVSFVLIALAVLLANAMTQTEDKAIATVNDLEEQSQMQAIADLARADALQVFTYNLRVRMEGWLTNPQQENYFPLSETHDCTSKEQCWQQLVDNYVSINFGGGCTIPVPGQLAQPCNQQFAHELTNNLVGTLSEGGSFGRYTVSLKIDKDKMEEALKRSIQNSTTDSGKKFFEVIDCPDEDQCDTGTFYVNVDLSKGAFDSGCMAGPTGEFPDSSACQNDDLIYESLPKIRVQNVATKNFLLQAILPRRQMRIYMPIRIFKAVAHAKRVADRTVFSGTFKNALENTALGICDTGSCNPRTDPQRAPGQTTWCGSGCPQSNRASIWPAGGDLIHNTPINSSAVSFSGTYDLHDEQITNRALKDFTTAFLKKSFDDAIASDPDPLNDGVAPSPPPAIDDSSVTVRIHPYRDGYAVIGTGGPDPAPPRDIFVCGQVQNVTFRILYNEKNQLYRVNKNNHEDYRVQLNPDPVTVGQLGAFKPSGCTSRAGVSAGSFCPALYSCSPN